MCEIMKEYPHGRGGIFVVSHRPKMKSNPRKASHHTERTTLHSSATWLIQQFKTLNKESIYIQVEKYRSEHSNLSHFRTTPSPPSPHWYIPFSPLPLLSPPMHTPVHRIT